MFWNKLCNRRFSKFLLRSSRNSFYGSHLTCGAIGFLKFPIWKKMINLLLLSGPAHFTKNSKNITFFIRLIHNVPFFSNSIISHRDPTTLVIILYIIATISQLSSQGQFMIQLLCEVAKSCVTLQDLTKSHGSF